MLYDKRWDKQIEAKPSPSLQGLIAWLETQDPNEEYDWMNCDGMCLVGQYFQSTGISWGDKRTTELYREIIINNGCIAVKRPHTFGGALERARAALVRT